MIRKTGTTFYCFSPPVMLATFFIEVSLVVYTLWRYKLNTISRLVMLMVGCLATFQLAEYIVCLELDAGSFGWTQVGFVAITMLPPLGIHLVTEISGGRHRWLAWVSYGSAAIFAGIFVFMTGAIERQVCGGNYIIFNLHSSINWLYGLYYYGWLLVGVVYSLLQVRCTKVIRIKRRLWSFVVGYVLFVLPTITINLIDPSTIRGIPSIMCGFAVVFALTLVFWTMPSATATKEHR